MDVPSIPVPAPADSEPVEQAQAPAADPILEPFRLMMVELTSQPFSAKIAKNVLPQLERIVNVARSALRLRDPKSVLDKSRRFACNPIYEYNPGMGDDDEETANGSFASKVTDRESFGVAAIRELVSTLKPQTVAAPEIVKAIAVAREHGLTDVADDLFRQLHVLSAAPSDAAAALGVASVAATVVSSNGPMDS